MYDKLFNIMLTLRDLREKFQTWSSTDIKNLISATMKSKREPRDLKELYALADMINDLRVSLDAAKHENEALNPGALDLEPNT